MYVLWNSLKQELFTNLKKNLKWCPVSFEGSDIASFNSAGLTSGTIDAPVRCDKNHQWRKYKFMTHLFLQQLRLNNFMLHEDTTVRVTKPILVLSGSNGSGKTQLVEALILVFGEKTGRAKKVDSLVGPYGPTASVEVVLANRLPNGTAVFPTTESDEKLRQVLAQPTVVLQAVVSGRKIQRKISSPELGFSLPVTQRKVQELMRSVGLRPGNQLTFTMGETVDVFANQTPYRKFQVLLENLGLQELRDEIVNNEKAIEQAVKDTSRLQRKLGEEEHNLELFRSMFEAIQQRDKLESLLESLVVEQRWVDVVELEQQLAERRRVLAERSEALERQQNVVSALQAEVQSHQRRLDNLQDRLQTSKEQRKTMGQEIKELTRKKNTLEGTLDSLWQDIEGHQAEIDRLRDMASNRSTLKDKQTRQLESRQLELRENREQQRRVDKALQLVERELTEQRTQYPPYELELIEASVHFRDNLASVGLANEVVGPFIAQVRLADYRRDQSWLPAVKQGLGTYLYSFLAMNPSAFKRSKQLYDSLWPDHKPAFDVFRFEEGSSAPRILPDSIYAFVPDLLAGDGRVLETLHRISTVALAADVDPNHLVTAARQTGLDVLTRDGRSFYRRKGSFSRPPRPFVGELGEEVAEPKKQKELRAEKKELTDELAQLKLYENTLHREIHQIRGDLALTGGPTDKIEDQIAFYQKQVEATYTRHSLVEDELAEVTEEVGEKGRLAAELEQEEELLVPQIGAEQKFLTQKETLLGQARVELADVRTIHQSVQSQVAELEENLVEVVAEVEKVGQRPDEVRGRHTVDLELREVRTKLAMVENESVPREKLENQEKRVVELRDNLEKRRDHLENLRSDVSDRYETWKRQIEPFVLQLADKLRDLTAAVFADTRLTIDPPDDLEKAGLVLQAVTKEAWRADQSLSGGEKVLLMESLILALHALTTSPIHVIDEFTQRLDTYNKTRIFKIVRSLVGESLLGQFVLVTPDTLGIEIEDDIQHLVVSEVLRGET